MDTITEVGNRVIYDTKTGRIIYQLGEAKGNVIPHEPINGLDYIDLPYGCVESGQYLDSIDTLTKEPIIKVFDSPLSPMEQRIKELEDELLLQTEKEVGGIL